MLTGFLLGLSIILPIGAQNLFILTQARTTGLPKALIPALVAALNDSMLIFLGYLGASQLIMHLAWVKNLLLLLGVIVLAVLGYNSLTAKIDEESLNSNDSSGSTRSLIVKTLAVSLLNPHVLIDTVGIIGGSIAALPADKQPSFVAGCILASFTWFFALAVFSSTIIKKLSPPQSYLD